MEQEPPNSENTSGIHCQYCVVSFTRKISLNQHIRKFHPDKEVKTTRKQTVNLCCFCDEDCFTISNLHKHMSEHHDFALSHTKKTFYSETEFYEWKDQMEKDTQIQFVVHYSWRELQDGRKVMHFKCNRSGVYKPYGQGKRHLKVCGTQKIGRMCPAYITVYKTVEEELVEIEVEFQSVHAGHLNEIGRIRLTSSEKRQLAGEMCRGVPKTTILSKLRENFVPDKRICYTNMKDLHNIAQSFRISNGVTLHEDDAKSVDFRVQQLMKEEYNPVLMYNSCIQREKGQNESDLCVILDDQAEEHEVICQELLKSSTRSDSIEMDIKSLKVEFEQVINESKHLTKEHVKVLREHVTSLKHHFKAIESSNSSFPEVGQNIAKEPVNKNITPQRRYFQSSTKRKRKD